MAHAKVLAALEKDAKTQVEALSVKIALEDRGFTSTENEKYFIAHSVVFGEGEEMSIGGACQRYIGIQYLSIHYRTGHGVQTIYEMADKLMTRYKHLTIVGDPSIVFRVASTVKQPPDAKGFAQLQVVCPFYFDIRS